MSSLESMTSAPFPRASRAALVAAALLALAALWPGIDTWVRALRGVPAAEDPQLAGGVLLAKSLLGFHAVLLLALEVWRARRALRARRGAAHLRLEPLGAQGLRSDTDAGRPGLVLALTGLLVLAALLRARGLDQGLWFDEIDTLVSYARHPLREVLTTFDSQNQHLLYSILARLSVAAFGESAWALRLPAAVFGVASLFAVWRLARCIAPRAEALFAVGLLAVSYHHVWFSQNARGYTGLLFFTTLGSEAFLRLLAERDAARTRLAWAYGACMAAAVWVHGTAVLAVAAHGLIWLALLWRARRREHVVRWLPGLAFVLAASLSLALYALVLEPFLETLSKPTLAGQAIEWKSPLWTLRETLRGLAKAVPGKPGAGLLFVALGGAVLALGIRSYARQSLVVLATLLLPAVTTAAALVATKHNLWPRFFFFSAGAGVLVVGRGLVEWVRLFARHPPLSTWSRPLTTALLVLPCLASAATLPAAWAPKQDFAAAVAFLEREVRPGDEVVTIGMTSLPLRDLYAKPWPSVDNLASLEAIEAAHERTWLVTCTPTHFESQFPAVARHAEERYERRAVFPGTVGGSEIVILITPK